MIKTKQELLNHFSDINAMYNNPFMYQTLSNMIDELLEQQLCEDAISRKRLIILIDEGAELHPYKVVGDSETYSNYNQGWTDAFDWLYANIDCDNLPSVKPQQEKGKWIEKEYMDTGLSEIWCSNCKDSNFYNQTDNPFIPTNYCPNCGADMRGDADETNN